MAADAGNVYSLENEGGEISTRRLVKVWPISKMISNANKARMEASGSMPSVCLEMLPS